MNDKAERHNEVAVRLFRDILKSTNHSECETMAVLETLIFGVLSVYAKLSTVEDKSRYMGEMLTALHDGVIGRMKP